MKLSAILLAVFLLIILSAVVSAECTDPLDAYHKCLAGCPNAVADTEGAAKCDNVCIGNHMKDYDAYLACQKQEREDAALEAKQADAKRIEEQKRLAEEKRLKELENKSYLFEGSGSISVFDKNGRKKDPNQKYIELSDGDVVSTGRDSVAGIRMPDGSFVRVGPNSKFKYVESQVSVSNVNKFTYYFLLYGGKMHAMVKLTRNKFEIRTPTSVTSTRATDFIVVHDEATNTTTVYLYEGALEVNDTKDNSHIMDPMEIFMVDTAGFKMMTTLSQANWDGLVKSVENGTEFTPLPETSKTIPENLKPVNQEQIVEPTAQKLDFPWTALLVGIAIILFAAFIFSQRKKLHKK